MSKFLQKLVNSGFSLHSSQLIVVHGVTRYLEMVRDASRNSTDPKYKPLYWDKEYKKVERKLSKFGGKSNWYKGEKSNRSNWWESLPVE